jgi:uncharacterized membrane protein
MIARARVMAGLVGISLHPIGIDGSTQSLPERSSKNSKNATFVIQVTKS